VYMSLVVCEMFELLIISLGSRYYITLPNYLWYSSVEPA
jgi:hypothetical protein